MKVLCSLLAFLSNLNADVNIEGRRMQEVLGVSIEIDAFDFKIHTSAKRKQSNLVLAIRWTATEADDVTVGVLDVEVFCAPRGSRERLEDRCTVGDAPLVERFDAVDAC